MVETRAWGGRSAAAVVTRSAVRSIMLGSALVFRAGAVARRSVVGARVQACGSASKTSESLQQCSSTALLQPQNQGLLVSYMTLVIVDRGEEITQR